jgi:phosphomannomutase
MTQRLAFGTAGIRGPMVAGNSGMNQLVVLQTTQGVCRYLLESVPDARTRGVVVGYDGRHNSRLFAETAAAVLLSQGIVVHLFSRLTATPMVPFGVLDLGAAAGIMITASHNPKDDNGYKLYWTNGAQIIPPVDAHVASAIAANLRPWQPACRFEPGHALLRDPSARVIERYMSEIGKRYCAFPAANKSSALRVTYTAMHGVGYHYVQQAFSAFSLPPVIPVAEQVAPDPDFPTVKFPNPEEGKGALALAMRTADAAKSDLILANDPDADRLAVAERDRRSGQWVVLNGNQIGLLLAHWAWERFRASQPDAAPQRAFMLSSTVSSQILRAMAAKEGFRFADTLTGFKWMGNVAARMIAEQGLTFLFAFEVEIGFGYGDLSFDKDGIRTAAILTEMAVHLRAQGHTLLEHLQTLYARYGHFEMNTSYFFTPNSAAMNAVFHHLRTGGPGGGFVKRCGEFEVESVRDVTHGTDSAQPDGKALLPSTPDSQMLTFRFRGGPVCTLRNSGTEPKLKYYVECSSARGAAEARKAVDALTDALIREWVQPERHGLIAKKPEA